MTEDRSILKLTEDVSWIGILDTSIVTFDIVMETPIIHILYRPIKR